MNPARRLPYTMLMAGLLLVTAIVLARRPYYNWDMFPYMAIIMAAPGEPFSETHKRVYSEARSHMPEQDFQAIAARQPELKEDAAACRLSGAIFYWDSSYSGGRESTHLHQRRPCSPL